MRNWIKNEKKNVEENQQKGLKIQIYALFIFPKLKYKVGN